MEIWLSKTFVGNLVDGAVSVAATTIAIALPGIGKPIPGAVATWLTGMIATHNLTRAVIIDKQNQVDIPKYAICSLLR